MGMMEEAAGVFAAVLGVLAVVWLLTIAFGVLVWVLQSLGLYTIANRRGLKHPWMAWIPVANLWILGSISDQYYYVARGKVKNRRKWLIALSIVSAVMVLAFIVVWVGALGNVIFSMADMYMEPSQEYIEQLMLEAVAPMMGVELLMWIVGMWMLVLEHMCYYGLYSSCDPQNKIVYTVVGILINVTLPFFVFACRNKDLGMPPRKPVAPEIPVKVVEAEVEEPVNGSVNDHPAGE